MKGQVPDDEPLLVLDRIADPGNLGTIIRTADWFNFRHIVCSPDCVEFYNPKTIQATMGSFAHVHVHTHALVPFLQARAGQHRILGAFLQGESIHSFAFQPTDIIVIGSESKGISPEVEKIVTHKITIPSPAQGRNTAESLNAAVATSIILYQASKTMLRSTSFCDSMSVIAGLSASRRIRSVIFWSAIIGCWADRSAPAVPSRLPGIAAACPSNR